MKESIQVNLTLEMRELDGRRCIRCGGEAFQPVRRENFADGMFSDPRLVYGFAICTGCGYLVALQ